MFTIENTNQQIKELTPELSLSIRKHIEHTGWVKSSEAIPPFGADVLMITSGYDHTVVGNLTSSHESYYKANEKTALGDREIIFNNFKWSPMPPKDSWMNIDKDGIVSYAATEGVTA